MAQNYSVNCPSCRVTLLVPHSILSTGGILACTACGAHFQCAPITGPAASSSSTQSKPQQPSRPTISNAPSQSNRGIDYKSSVSTYRQSGDQADKQGESSEGPERRYSSSSQASGDGRSYQQGRSSNDGREQSGAQHQSPYPSLYGNSDSSFNVPATSSGKQYFAPPPPPMQETRGFVGASPAVSGSSYTPATNSQQNHFVPPSSYVAQKSLSPIESSFSAETFRSTSERAFDSSAVEVTLMPSRIDKVVKEELSALADKIKAAALEDLKAMKIVQTEKSNSDVAIKKLKERHEDELRSVEEALRRSFRMEVDKWMERYESEKERSDNLQRQVDALQDRTLKLENLLKESSDKISKQSREKSALEDKVNTSKDSGWDVLPSRPIDGQIDWASAWQERNSMTTSSMFPPLHQTRTGSSNESAEEQNNPFAFCAEAFALGDGSVTNGSRAKASEQKAEDLDEDIVERVKVLGEELAAGSPKKENQVKVDKVPGVACDGSRIATTDERSRMS